MAACIHRCIYVQEPSKSLFLLPTSNPKDHFFATKSSKLSKKGYTTKNLFLGYLNKEKSKLKSFHEKLLKYNSIKIFKKSFYNFKKIPLDNQKKLNKDFKLILNKLSK